MFGYEHFGMGLGWLWMVLIWMVPILLTILFLHRFSGDRGAKASAAEVLAARYARGEIDRDEYLKRLADLED